MNIKKLKEKQGITLIALIITIIVLLILAGISIAMLAGDNGILTRTKSAKKTSEIAGIKEEIKTEIIAEQAGNEGNISEDALKAILEKHGTINYDEDGEKIKSITTKEGYEISMSDIWTGTAIKTVSKTISKTKSYVGCYADIEGDGTVDGIIYADLAVGNQGSGQWYDSDGEYTIPTVTEGLKDYCVSQTNYKYNEGFGTKDVISPTGTGGSKERFYIMALEDIKTNGTNYDWYNAAFENIDSSITNTEFGTGKTNTTTMIIKWTKKAYGDQDKCSKHKDMWGKIQTKVNDGWFVPSKAEWAAFAGKLGISEDSSNKKYYGNFDLSSDYWSSSLRTTKYAWSTNFSGGYMSNTTIGGYHYVRLSATF